VGGDLHLPAVTLSAVAEAGGERLDADGVGDRARAVLAAMTAAEVTALGGRLRAGPGVRLERTGDHAGISAKLGGSLALAGPLSLRASAGRTYRVPSFMELYLEQGVIGSNPDLRPEVGVGGDGALVAEGPLGTVSLGAFATLYRDLIVYELQNLQRFVPRNVDRTVMRGLEVEVATAPLRRLAGLSSALSYTYTASEILRGVPGVVGKDVPRRPRHRLHGRLDVGGPAAAAHAEVEWIARQYLDLANLGATPESLTLGAGGSLRLLRAPDVHLHLELRNLLDDRSLQDSYGYPIPGRTVLVTLRASFIDPRRSR
jgi:vitamin B12 transporter